MFTSKDSSQKPVDILVIGAGASGGAATAWLAEAGFNVKCLEQGFWQDPSKYASASEDYEFEMLTNWAPDPNVRQRDEDYPVNDSNSPVTPVMFNGVGGSTILWTAHTPRFHPSDFRVKTLDGVADDDRRACCRLHLKWRVYGEGAALSRKAWGRVADDAPPPSQKNVGVWGSAALPATHF